MLRFVAAPGVSKMPDMESCDDCAMLEHELSRASEHYVSLITQHDQMIRNSAPNASTLDNPIKKARRRRNATARLLLSHRASHEARPKTRTAGEPFG